MSEKPSFFAELKRRNVEQSCQDRAGADIGWIKVDSLCDPLRGAPGFEAIAEKIVPALEFRGSSK